MIICSFDLCMKIAYISGVKFGHELLIHILKNGFKIDVLFTYKSSKKKIHSDYAFFDEISSKYKIKHIKVDNINEKTNVELLRSINPDIILVMGWSQLIKTDILEIPRIGTIGSHPTLLPKYRGRAPIPWSIIKDLKESALTFFCITKETDQGDIILQRKFKITINDDASSIYEKVISAGKKMILETLSMLEEDKITKIKQKQADFIEYWPKRTPKDGKIEWTKSGKEIHTLIRATTHPYPGAYTFFKKSKLKIWKAKFLDTKTTEPGKIIHIGKYGVKIGTGKGTILIQKASLGNNKEVGPHKIFSNGDKGYKLGGIR